MRVFSRSILFFLSLFLLSSIISAQSERAVMLSNKLNNLKMFDYSVYLLEKKIAERPADLNRLKIQLADTYFYQNKVDEAIAILNAIPQSDPFYPISRMVLGMKLVERGKNQDAVEALEQYFAAKKSDPPETEHETQEFKNAIAYLQHAYTSLGDTENIKRVADYILILTGGKMEEGEGGAFPGGREGMVLKGRAVLDAAEQNKKTGKAGWETDVNATIKTLQEVLWGGQDYYTALAYVERARGLYLLGRYADALKEISETRRKNLIKAFDDGFKEQGKFANAPSAHMYFWLGHIYLAMAGEKTAEEDQIKMNTRAVGSLFKVINEYEGFYRMDDAIGAFNKCKKNLEALGKELDLPPEFNKKLGNRLDFIRKQADIFFTDEKYEEAIPIYLKAIRNGRSSKNAPDVLRRLVFAYLQTGREYEAMALAYYMGDCHPKSEDTPITLVQTGEFLWDNDKKDYALDIYEKYVTIAPSHQYADKISIRIANKYYDRAINLAEEANKMPQGEDKLRKFEEAMQAYREAIPKYIFIVENYQHTDMGTTGYYYLSLCYTSAKEYLKGAETFLHYAGRELARKEKSKIDYARAADAKFRAAQNFFEYADKQDKKARSLEKELEEMNSGNPPRTDTDADAEAQGDEEAKAGTPESIKAEIKELKAEAEKYFASTIEHCNDYIDNWAVKGGKLDGHLDNEKVKNALVGSYSMKAWSLDGMDKVEEACKAFAEFIDRYPENEKKTPACMSRLGILYFQLKNYNSAAQTLETLANRFPDTREGKEALSILGRSMYETERYDKSIEAFSRIFQQEIELQVYMLKWIAVNLADCGGKHPKAGAEIALKACRILFGKIKNPVLSEWVPKSRIPDLEADPELAKKTIGNIREKLLYDAGNAALYAEQPAESLKYLDELLKNEDSPYFYKGRFLRAQVHRSLEQYEKAIDNYSKISLTSSQARRYDIYTEAQCRTGDTYIEQGDFARALAAFFVIAVVDLEDKIKQIEDENTPEKKREHLKTELEWIEYALYGAARCHGELGEGDRKDEMVRKYRKHFPDGQWRKEIDNIQTKSAPAGRTESADAE